MCFLQFTEWQRYSSPNLDNVIYFSNNNKAMIKRFNVHMLQYLQVDQDAYEWKQEKKQGIVCGKKNLHLQGPSLCNDIERPSL